MLVYVIDTTTTNSSAKVLVVERNLMSVFDLWQNPTRRIYLVRIDNFENRFNLNKYTITANTLVSLKKRRGYCSEANQTNFLPFIDFFFLFGVVLVEVRLCDV